MAKNKKTNPEPGHIKRRFIGLITLFALAAIFVPMLLHEKPQIPAVQYTIPNMPIDLELIQLEPQSLTQQTQIAKKPSSPQYSASKSKTPDTQNIWTLKVATFSVSNNAKNLKKQLQKDGFKAYTKTYTNQNKTFYVLYVGPETQKDKLNQFNRHIFQKFDIKGEILPFKVE